MATIHGMKESAGVFPQEKHILCKIISKNLYILKILYTFVCLQYFLPRKKNALFISVENKEHSLKFLKSRYK